MSDLDRQKAVLRKAALARRKAAHAARPDGWAAVLASVLADYRGRPLAGYMPLNSEIDPLPAMAKAAADGPVAVPVIAGPGQPLSFARWTPGMAMREGPFGVRTPCAPLVLTPEIVIVPLVAFDASGGRLGYGGGYYDRTLAQLRARHEVVAIGFAYAAQEIDAVPVGAQDARLDLIVTERDIRRVPTG